MVEILIWSSAAIIGVGISLYKRHRRKTYLDEAGVGDLQLDAGGGFMDNLFGGQRHAGVHRGVPVGVRRTTEGGRNNRQEYTVYEAKLGPDAPAGLKVVPEGFTGSIGNMLGLQDIQIGDDILDPTFVIKGENEVEVRRYLGRPGIPGQVLELYGEDWTGFRIDDGTITVKETGHFYDSAVLEQRLDHLVDLVHALNGSEPPEEQTTGTATGAGSAGAPGGQTRDGEEAEPSGESTPGRGSNSGGGEFVPPS